MVEGKHSQNAKQQKAEKILHIHGGGVSCSPRMQVTKSRKSKRHRMGKTGAKEVKAQEKRAGSTKRETEVEVKARSTKRETEAKRVTHESQARRSGEGTAVCENSTRLVALTGKTRLGASEQLSLKLGM